MKIQTQKVIDSSDWDEFVRKTYNRPYCFQQQDGCKDRGNFYLQVPEESDDITNDTVPEIVNHKDMGVSFAAWLSRDPKTPIKNQKYDRDLELWWHRNFYPDVQMIANDLNAKGLLESGNYTINIDW
jgi:hypothetical protein